jgi:hypothetical protein
MSSQRSNRPHSLVVFHSDVTYMWGDCQERCQRAFKNADTQQVSSPCNSLVLNAYGTTRPRHCHQTELRPILQSGESSSFMGARIWYTGHIWKHLSLMSKTAAARQTTFPPRVLVAFWPGLSLAALLQACRSPMIHALFLNPVRQALLASLKGVSNYCRSSNDGH